MIASNGITAFNNTFVVDTGTAPNLNVTENIGYESGDLGSLSHEEQLRTKVIAAGKPAG
jgi:MFS-type transporter involved in bile tolerance (Atg22 family)